MDNQGDREAQLTVLLTNPDKRHCELWQVQTTACSSCPKNPRRNGGEEAAIELEAWTEELQFVQQFLRLKQAGIVFAERDLLRFEAELAVTAHEVLTQFRDEEQLLKIPVKHLTPEESERRREILKARVGKLSN